MNERDQIIAAIVTQYDANSTEQARTQAINFCNSILPNMSLVDAYALSQWKHPFVQYFGAICIEYDIKWRWEELKHSFPETLSFLLNSIQNGLFLNEKFINEKITKVIVEIKLKQYFDSFAGEINLEDISVLFNGSNEYQVTLGLLLYRALFEEVFEFNEHYTKTKGSTNKLATLKKSMSVHSTNLLSLCCQVFEALLKSEPRNENLFKETIKTFSTIVSWGEFKEVLSTPMWALLFSLLPTQEYKNEVLDCLLLLLNRQDLSAVENKKEILVLFGQISVFQNTAKSLLSEMETRKELTLISFEKLTTILTLLGNIHLHLPANNSIQTMPSNYFEFIELISELTNFCTSQFSISMARDLSNFWKLFLGSGIFAREVPDIHQAFVVDIVNKLLAIFGSMHVRKKSKNEDEEYEELFREMSSSGSHIFTVLAAKFPFQSLDYIISIFSELSQLMTENPPVLDQNQELYFDGLFMQIKHIMNEIPLSINPIVDKAKENISAFLQMVFMSQIKSYFIAHQLLKIISAFFRFYPISKEILEKTIEFAIQHCVYSQPQESVSHFSSETIFIRREGFSTLLKLANSVSLEEYIPYIVSRFNELHDKLAVCEKAQVTETLVSISNGFNNYAKQQDFLSQILGDQIERWCNAMTPLLESPYDFLNFFGINQLSEDDGQANDVVMSRITEFVLFVSGLVQILKRVAIPKSTEVNTLRLGGYLDESNGFYPIKHPLQNIDIKLLPNLLKLIAILHSINNPTLRANIPDDWQMIFFTGNIYMFKERYRVDVFGENNSVLHTNKKEINCLLQNLREHVYSLFSAFCSHKVGLYPLDVIHDVLRDSVFSADLYYMGFGNAQEYLNKVITPLITNCPPYLYDSIIPLYCDFLVKYYSLILSEWNYNKAPNDKEELIHDISKNIALSEFVNSFKMTLFPIKQCTELFQYMLTSKTEKIGILIQLMADLTLKKFNSIISDTAYAMIKSTITQLSQAKVKSVIKREILGQILSLIFDHDLKIVDIDLIVLMFSVDHKFMREKILQFNGATETIKKELQSNVESQKNVQNLKNVLKNFFKTMGYTSQHLSFIALNQTET